MRDLNNPRHLMLIVAEAKDAVNKIIEDPELAHSFRNESIFMCLCNALLRYEEEITTIVSAFDGECAQEDVFSKYSSAEIIRLFEDITNNELFDEIVKLFTSALKKKVASSSGSAQVATPV
jgi:hypothetical protein